MSIFKSIKSIFLSLILITTIVISGAGQDKWEQELDEIEEEFEQGAYDKVYKDLEKFKSKVVKKLGGNNKYMAEYYLKKARANVVSGFLMGLDESIDHSLDISKTIYGADDVEHAINQMKVVDIYLRYGNYVKAKNYLDRAEQTFKKTDQYNENYKAKLDLKRAQVLTGQGYYNQSLDVINDQIDYFRSRAVTKETYVDESGKLKTRRLEDSEVNKRLSNYATLLTTKANTFRKKGVYLSADSAFTRAAVWIEENLDNTSFEYAQNQYLHGRFLVENGLLEFSGATKDMDFERTLAYLKRKHDESHYLAFDLYETLLKWLQYQDKKAKYGVAEAEYERAITKNFDKTSLHYINLQTIEFDVRLLRDRTRNVGAEVNSVLASNRALPENHEKKIQLIDILYQLAIQNRDYQSAEKYLSQILNIKKVLFGEDSPEYHLSKIELANYYIDHTDKIEEAQKIYNESFFGIVDKQIDTWHKDYVNILDHIALYYQITDQYDLAATTLKSAENAAREKFRNTDPNYGVQLNELGKLYLKIGRYAEARENIDAAVVILENERKNEDRVLDYVEAIQTQAKLKVVEGYFDEAKDLLDRSERLQRRAENIYAYNELEAAEELAAINIAIGEYSDTYETLLELLKTYEKRYGSDSRKLIEPLMNIGKIELINGEYTKAEKTASRVRGIALSTFGENSTKTAPTLSLLASVYTSIGDYQKAQDNAQTALKTLRDQFGEIHIDVAKSIEQLALIKFYKGDNIDDVERLMNQAGDIITDQLGRVNPSYARLLVDLAKVYIPQKKYDEAFNALSLAQSIWENKVGGRNNINTASIYVLKGDIYYLLKNFENSEDSYSEAESLYARNFNKNHPEYVKVLSKLSKVYYMQKDKKKANDYIEEAIDNYQNFIKNYFPALSEREKAKYWNTIKPDFEFYNTLAFELSNEDDEMVGKVYNNALLTKAILLNSSIKIRERILNSDDEELKENYTIWQSKKENLTKALSLSVEQLNENDINIDALQREVEQLEKDISERSELFSQANDSREILWEDVQGVLKPNEVAIEMVRYRHFDHVFTDSIVYAALYLKHKDQQKNPQAAFIKNGDALENKFYQNYRNSIIFNIEDYASYNAYWKPLKNVVGQYATIYLSPDGVYNQINLEAIPAEKEGKYILDYSNIILLNNTKDLYFASANKEKAQDQKFAQVFGNPDFYLASTSGPIQPLPGTAVEVKQLGELLKSNGWVIETYTNLEAREEQIKKVKSPKVFHIATHGFFTPTEELDVAEQVTMSESEEANNPLLRTGLLLTGAGDLLEKAPFNYNLESGILTAYEAMNLNLDQTELVVLSACETGLGELAIGEGVYGLQRAFLVAGAKTLIMSMFKVPDQPTQELMSTFYQKWIETGQKRKSFIEAKKEIRTKYPDPINWGAFVMIGLD